MISLQSRNRGTVGRRSCSGGCVVFLLLVFCQSQLVVDVTLTLVEDLAVLVLVAGHFGEFVVSVVVELVQKTEIRKSEWKYFVHYLGSGSVEKLCKIQISLTLKKQLVDDWDSVT
ncbi:hypothetical protein V8G54_020485 [Vigna mungo]|uniref:Uncharacterized protein n=1 Tax=Vigna mungo TaxID=3915 RepID=A0AAQ3NBX8_VIGMU